MQPVATFLAALTSLCVAVVAHAGDPSTPAPEELEEQGAAQREGEEEFPQAGFSDLRERLTEREDQNRVEDPWTTELWGHPLSLAGEAETWMGFVEELSLGEPDEDYDRLLFEAEIEAEAFYSIGPLFSVFLQARLAFIRDLRSQTPDRLSTLLLERGEMWIHTEDILGTGLNLHAGALDFEDDRLWWWDEGLDAVRLAYETDTFEATLAAAEQIAPRRTSQSYIDPEMDGVFRLIGEASWDWHPHHAVELFGLYHHDHSGEDHPGGIVRRSREDESDATLAWVGFRAMGASTLDSGGIFGYWLDTAVVWGGERWVEFVDLPDEMVMADEAVHRDVSGWAVDAGVNWILPWALEPRLFAGYAIGSGDPNPESGDDRSFRQSGLHGNEPGFGGVQRFGQYGNLLDPELSNLGVVTLGLGLTLFDSSSVDLVYHYYHQMQAATFLRDVRFDAELDGRHRDVGHGIDVVLAIEEWKRLELEFDVSVFRSGDAFVVDRHEWTYGLFGSIRLAF
jgi:hypothetical protein